MIKEFQKYDKSAQRTVYMKTADFNNILEKANAAVRVIPRNTELKNSYDAYVHSCHVSCESPLPIYEYGEKYFMASCSFQTFTNVPSEILLSKALGVKSVCVEYAKDMEGHQTDDELEITYRL